ncbi:S-adenosyl-L-methionine-dependent methyltransferase [Xylariomycetidae sp. FL2044]|nr:S-adenosyl-L-methionine-dependent methyltransferase [Xylariomycetidae sp. FL2044]
MTIAALSEIISQQAAVLEEARTRLTYADHNGDQQLTSARSRLLEACDKLHTLVLGPEEYMLNLATGHRAQAALQYVCHFRLARLIPADGTPVSYDEVARRTGVPAVQCVRILRLLMTYHIFREPGTRLVAHNRNSRVLLDSGDSGGGGGGIGPSVEWYVQEPFRASAFLAEASEKWPGSGEAHETALNLAFDTRLPSLSFMAGGAAGRLRTSRYARAMTGMARNRQYGVEHLVAGFDWKSLPAGTVVVDVGGGNGYCSRALAEANHGLRLVVQDLRFCGEGDDDVVIDTDVHGRLRFMAHDFFDPQPVAADVYLLRRILHHHPAKDAVRILQAQLVAVAKRPGARIVVMDDIAIRSGMLTTLEERRTRTADIGMMSLYNSAERDLSDWRALFKAADPRLRLVEVTKPPGSALSIMELSVDRP